MATRSQAPLTFAELKEKQRRLRDGFHPNLGLRVHRSLSWLHRAEFAGDDCDACFIFLWISFNAAYAEDDPELLGHSERSVFGSFFVRLLELDHDQLLYEAVWTKFSGPVRSLLDNQFTYQPFWNYHNGLAGYEDWEERFIKSRKRISEALGVRDTQLILSTLFDRLYVLRNQVIHGGATWNSSVNRSQIKDGARLLKVLVPSFLQIMMDGNAVVWGKPNYPVVEF